MRLFPLYLFALTMMFGACSKSSLPTYPAKWAESWPSEEKPAQFDSLSKVYYEASRDESNLYLHLSTQDPASQMRIMRYGLSIWLDQSGAKKTQTGFSFPVAPPDSVAGQGFGGRFGGGNGGGERPPRSEGNGSGRGDRAGGGPPSPEEMQKRMLGRIYKRFNEKPKELVQMGYDGKKKSYILGKDPCDIQVDLEIEDDNSLHYFAVIPLKKIFSNEKYKGDVVSIGIVSGYYEVDPEAASMMGGGGNPSGGGGGGRAFFMQMMQQMTTPVEIWFRSDLKANKK